MSYVCRIQIDEYRDMGDHAERVPVLLVTGDSWEPPTRQEKAFRTALESILRLRPDLIGCAKAAVMTALGEGV